MFTNEQIQTFSDLEYELYNYIMKNSREVTYMRIRELANETHVSTTTILRFCKKLGFDGFTEFKVHLKNYLAEEETYRLNNTYTTVSDFVERTLSANYETKIREIAEVVAKAKIVIFIGAGTSGVIAEYGARFFSGLKKFSLHIKDPYFPIYSHYITDSVTIVLSVSGESKSTMEKLDRLKQDGSIIVSLTNHSDSSLAKMSDYNLAYYITTEYLGNVNLTTQIPVMFLIERLGKETFDYMQSSLIDRDEGK
ncbi:MurR/RpiR family transcriptional regulator [Niallia taxi]|uniref:MurR/RpiR family transcriptional regulator n=1 Tax=Niallia taxi TaxID=2499688 RepID=A0A3S3SJN7_9BACI|nr:MurR/RpiR family transcriptional regulator [Niallia taxi]MCM3216633.1 MurR/RpiR family transcriptional regulator [Niallia taxi]MCT2344267.1 MurR/RpiR family transcriptional regulator [Niallia taxi]MDE5053707.1 MurR/RpiR family transcriptional regulator [Niallia taxi]MDK8639998.1 MurR/RpiR family transcriptional regulator [Niallia taxi]MED3964265.1 MurR/RpiR family transcriptional regulator [Niallia taxi]